MAKAPRTRIATSDASSITVRGHDLVGELMGRRSFTEMLYFHAAGRWPTPGEAQALDACLVTLMEHGLTPTAIITRLLADNVPDEPQVALAGGLLAVGSVFVGTMEGAGGILAAGVASDEPAADYCRRVVAEYRADKRAIPGFGHPQHKPDDPRPPRLFEIAREAGVSGPHIALLQALSAAVDAAMGRHLTINATGAIAAVLLDIGLPQAAMRGIAVVSRSGGLLGHLLEEQETGSGRHIWQVVEEAIPYEPDGD